MDTDMNGLLPVLNTPMIDTHQLLDLYIKTLSEKELRAYMIAKTHLGSSFDLSKSVGFVQWKSRL